MQLVGAEIASKPSAGAVPGLVLWQVQGDPRVTTWTQGLLANGDIGPEGTATLDVYQCGIGVLRLRAVGLDNAKVTLSRDGTTVSSYDLWPQGTWEQTIPTGPGSRRCSFSRVGERARAPERVQLDARRLTGGTSTTQAGARRATATSQWNSYSSCSGNSASARASPSAYSSAGSRSNVE